jgi:hypothetical protein
MTMQFKIDRKTGATTFRACKTDITDLTRAASVLEGLARVTGTEYSEAAVKAKDGVSRVLAMLRGEVQQPQA